MMTSTSPFKLDFGGAAVVISERNILGKVAVVGPLAMEAISPMGS